MQLLAHVRHAVLHAVSTTTDDDEAVAKVLAVLQQYVLCWRCVRTQNATVPDVFFAHVLVCAGWRSQIPDLGATG